MNAQDQEAQSAESADMRASFTLAITLGNDAMRQPDHIASALEGIAHRLRREGYFGTDSAPIRDYNGNTVGEWHLS